MNYLRDLSSVDHYILNAGPPERVAKSVRCGEPKIGRGSTGRTSPGNFSEQLAMEEAMSNPAAGKQIPVQMGDRRWPASAGWTKMTQTVNGHEIHYLFNRITGAVDDFKFK